MDCKGGYLEILDLVLCVESFFDFLGHAFGLVQQTLEEVICLVIVRLSDRGEAPIKSRHLIDT